MLAYARGSGKYRKPNQHQLTEANVCMELHLHTSALHVLRTQHLAFVADDTVVDETLICKTLGF